MRTQQCAHIYTLLMCFLRVQYIFRIHEIFARDYARAFLRFVGKLFFSKTIGLTVRGVSGSKIIRKTPRYCNAYLFIYFFFALIRAGKIRLLRSCRAQNLCTYQTRVLTESDGQFYILHFFFRFFFFGFQTRFIDLPRTSCSTCRSSESFIDLKISGALLLQ